ncbi:MAG: UDP-N-acetylglucosamine 2-epimerase (hydrolyzing) [Rhodospirillales bacterium]|nr:UDP-N-acetylglucosamine 2-epimerase (hydrolyzing) [Rhodospirillales bacterium]
MTGTRADFGHMRSLLHEINLNQSLILQLVVTGSHLSPRFGNTVAEITEDGLHIDERVGIEPADDSALSVAVATGEGVSAMALALDRLKPDIMVAFGDRYEMFAASQAAFIQGISLAHIQGGEITEAAMDDSLRHAITKLASLHFTASEEYSRRVIQLGENPERVLNVGALAVDNVLGADLLDQSELEKILKIQLKESVFLVTYHPETLEKNSGKDGISALLEALNERSESNVIFTGVNADPGYSQINELIHEYVKNHPGQATLYDSLGLRNYLSLMALATAVLGNSSSGVIEAPIMKVPTVNIGDRQRGRLRATSVIDCGASKIEIRRAIDKTKDAEFRASIRNQETPFGKGGTAKAITRYLEDCDLAVLKRKKFFDLPGKIQLTN